MGTWFALSPKMKLDVALLALGLQVLGVVEEEQIVLIGPSSEFWMIFQESEEFQDGDPDPIDRWSLRVIGDLATHFDAEALFPFGGSPYAPFLSWALKSGRAWNSPVGMLVHDTLGLMISYRGALRFKQMPKIEPGQSENPCDTCIDRPCMTACPVNAITAEDYDTDACASHLRQNPEEGCMNGCFVRLACPYSAGAERNPAQSRFHMEAFLRAR